jgi:hypothetical protein
MTQFSDFSYSAQESISSFTLHQQQYLIFPSNSNKNWNQDNPASWQFRYTPLFLPKLDSRGELETQIKQIGDEWTVYMTIFLDKNTAKELAFFSLSKVYREYEINRSNISAFPIRYSEIDIPELQTRSQFQILKRKFDFTGSETDFTIRIQTQNKRDAENLASEILPNSSIEYSYSASVNKLGQNFVRVTFDRIKDSSRFAKLIGFGDKAFIHRDDERLLAEEIYTQAKIDTYVEDKEQFIGEIQNQLMTFFEKNISIGEEKFDQEKWNRTYNQEDLRPDVLTKTLNKLFTKDEEENNWKINTSADLNCNAEVINKIKVAPIDLFDSTIKGGVATKGSLSNDDLKKLLRQYDITVEIEGNQIIPKSVNVKEMNLAKFKSTGSLEVKNQFIQSRETHIKGCIEIYKYSRNFNDEQIDESEINIELLLQELYNKYPNLNRSHDRDILAELILFIAYSMARNNKKYSAHQLIQISLGLHSESNLLRRRGSNSNSNYIDERYWLKLKDCLMEVEDIEMTAKVKTLLDETKNQEDIDNRDKKGQLLPPI